MKAANEITPAAVALAYQVGETAPRVVAKGHGIIAKEIIKRAKESGIYVHESSELVALLMQVNLDQHIPPQLYIVIAELLAWLYRMEEREQKSVPSANLDATNNSHKPESHE